MGLKFPSQDMPGTFARLKYPGVVLHTTLENSVQNEPTMIIGSSDENAFLIDLKCLWFCRNMAKPIKPFIILSFITKPPIFPFRARTVSVNCIITHTIFDFNEYFFFFQNGNFFCDLCNLLHFTRKTGIFYYFSPRRNTRGFPDFSAYSAVCCLLAMITKGI